MSSDPKLTRRQVTKAGLAATAGVLLGGLAPSRSEAEDLPLVTDVPELAPLVGSLQYVNESPHADKKCTNCILYSASAKEGFGKCTVFQNAWVSADGWCASWAKKPS